MGLQPMTSPGRSFVRVAQQGLVYPPKERVAASGGRWVPFCSVVWEGRAGQQVRFCELVWEERRVPFSVASQVCSVASEESKERTAVLSSRGRGV